jgi:hypothetical protein
MGMRKEMKRPTLMCRAYRLKDGHISSLLSAETIWKTLRGATEG